MWTVLKGFLAKPLTILIGVMLVILIGTTIFYYHAHNDELVVNGQIKSENGILKQNEDFTDKSNKITDQTVVEFVQKSKESTASTEQLRRESINEYVNKIEPKGGPQKEPTKDSLPDGADRVSKLADSMHENYCRARPKDLQCNPVNSNN